MHKKLLGLTLILVGILIFMGAGCAGKQVAPAPTKETNTKQATDNPTQAGPAVTDLMNADSSGLCASATETEAPDSQAKELKTIFNEAGGEMKFLADLPQDAQTGDTYIYVLKKIPTTAKLENAFKKHGYKIELSGSLMVVSKNNLYFSISLTDKGECQEVVIMTSSEPFKLGGEVTLRECQNFLEMVRHADIRNNNMYVAWTSSIKLFNYWFMLAAKYGVTKEAIEATCKQKLGI